VHRMPGAGYIAWSIGDAWNVWDIGWGRPHGAHGVEVQEDMGWGVYGEGPCVPGVVQCRHLAPRGKSAGLHVLFVFFQLLRMCTQLRVVFL